jgi:glucose repression regulatory protein TUP1
MTPPILQHRSLQPTGPPPQGPSQQHSYPRLNESYDTITKEFDVLSSELSLVRGQRDDFESKGESLADSHD